uniref:H15 domain-containing protein n=1 Tax=Steinernema glaseri TaxID=37863 RepID=A0A1I8A6H5_9BILA
MAEVALAEIVPATEPTSASTKASKKVAKKDKKAAPAKRATPTHPTYQAMIKEAIEALGERHGSSKAAIFKYICSNFAVGDNQIQSAALHKKAPGTPKKAVAAKPKKASKKPAGKKDAASKEAATPKKASKPKATTGAKMPKSPKAPKALGKKSSAKKVKAASVKA